MRCAQNLALRRGNSPDSRAPINNPGAQSVLRFKCSSQFRKFFAIVTISCAVKASNVIKRFLGCKSVLNET